MPSSLTASVALCTYNGERHIEGQLASLASQTSLPSEVVICDDASIDGTQAIVRHFARQAPFPVTLVVNRERLGATKNFEQAACRCREDIILFADQDDQWLPDHISLIAGALLNNPAAAYAFGDAVVVDDSGRDRGRSLWTRTGFRPSRQVRFKSGAQLPELVRQNPVTGAAMGIRRWLLNVARPFSAHMLHDEWLALMGSAMGFPAVLVERPVLKYRIHELQHSGVPETALHRRLEKRRQVLRSWLNTRIAAFGDLQSRLQTAGHDDHRTTIAEALATVDAKLMHLTRRAGAANAPWRRRLVTVSSELLLGGYARYSGGVRAAAVDCLGPTCTLSA